MAKLMGTGLTLLKVWRSKLTDGQNQPFKNIFTLKVFVNPIPLFDTHPTILNDQSQMDWFASNMAKTIA